MSTKTPSIKKRRSASSGFSADTKGGVVIRILDARPSGKRSARGAIITSTALVNAIQTGLPAEEIAHLKVALGVTNDVLAKVLGVSNATLNRRDAGQNLSPAEGDRVVRLARLLSQAKRVMGSLPAAQKWLATPQFGLGGAIPLDFASTEVGGREVEDLLGRIETGVYA